MGSVVFQLSTGLANIAQYDPSTPAPNESVTWTTHDAVNAVPAAVFCLLPVWMCRLFSAMAYLWKPFENPSQSRSAAADEELVPCPGPARNLPISARSSTGLPRLPRPVDRIAETPDAEAFRFLDDGRWTSVSWKQFGERVDILAAGLIALGIQAEDRVALVSSTRYEWVLAASP